MDGLTRIDGLDGWMDERTETLMNERFTRKSKLFYRDDHIHRHNEIKTYNIRHIIYNMKTGSL